MIRPLSYLVASTCLTLLHAQLSGQASRPSCRFRCSVEVEKSVSMGDSADGAVDGNQIIVMHGGKYFLSHSSHEDGIQVFDGQGRFESSIGKAGEGPGEFKAIRDIMVGPDGNLWILDRGNQRLSVVSNDGRVLDSFPARFGFNPGQALILPDSSLILNAAVPSAELIGFETHRWHPTRGFMWSVEGERRPAWGQVSRRTYALDDDGRSFWTAWMTEKYRLERRSLRDGRLLASFEPDREWFETYKKLPPPSADMASSDDMTLFPPQATITSIQILDGLLWVLGYTGATKWEQARKAGYMDLGVYLDNVIDVFEPASGTLLVSTRLSVEHTLLYKFIGPWIAAHETNPVIDKVTIYRAHLRGPVPRRRQGGPG